MPGIPIEGNIAYIVGPSGVIDILVTQKNTDSGVEGSTQVQQSSVNASKSTGMTIVKTPVSTRLPVTQSKLVLPQSNIISVTNNSLPIKVTSNGSYLSGDVNTQYVNGAWTNYTPEVVTDISDQLVTNMGLPYEEAFPLPHTWAGGFREFFFRDTGDIYLRTSGVLSLNTFKELRFTFSSGVYPALGTTFVQLRNYSNSWWSPTVTFNQSDILSVLATYGELTFKISGGSSNMTFPTVTLEKVEVVT